MSAKDIIVNRDYDNDILYVLKKGINPKTVTNLIVDKNTTIRLIKGTKEVVGFTIAEFSVNCSEWKEQKEYKLMEEFDEILNVLNDSCKRKLVSQASLV